MDKKQSPIAEMMKPIDDRLDQAFAYMLQSLSLDEAEDFLTALFAHLVDEGLGTVDEMQALVEQIVARNSTHH